MVRGEGDGSVGEGGWERYPLYRDIHAELVVLEDVEAQRQARCAPAPPRAGRVVYVVHKCCV